MLYIFCISAWIKSCFPSLLLINLSPISYSIKGSWTNAVVSIVIVVVVQFTRRIHVPYVITIISISRASKNPCTRRTSYRFNPLFINRMTTKVVLYL